MNKGPDFSEGYDKILVPIGHKGDINELTKMTKMLVNEDNGKAEFLHVTEEDNFSYSQKEWRIGSERVTKSQHDLMMDGIASKGNIRTSKSISQGILDEADDLDPDLILLGWSSGNKIKLKRFVSKILKKADCDVIVFKALNDPKEISNILLPVSIVPNENRIQMTTKLIKKTDANLTLAYISKKGDEFKDQGEKILNKSASLMSKYGLEPKKYRTSASNITEKIGEVSKDYDLMILGTSREWWLSEYLFGRKTDEIAKESSCSVLMHKWQGEIVPDE